MNGRIRTTSLDDHGKNSTAGSHGGFKITRDKDGNKVSNVLATTGSYPDQAEEISYTDTKVTFLKL